MAVVSRVFLFYLAETGSLTDQIVSLMERMVENVSFGLEMFESKQQKERVSRMFGALSATNEAIMRAKTRDELFQTGLRSRCNWWQLHIDVDWHVASRQRFSRYRCRGGPVRAKLTALRE